MPTEMLRGVKASEEVIDEGKGAEEVGLEFGDRPGHGKGKAHRLIRLWGICPTMAEGILLVFHLPVGSSAGKHRTFRRRVYGEETSSWGGKYRYRRKGLLDGTPHIRLYWGVVIVEKGNGGKMAHLLREEGATVLVRRVILTRGDEGGLQ